MVYEKFFSMTLWIIFGIWLLVVILGLYPLEESLRYMPWDSIISVILWPITLVFFILCAIYIGITELFKPKEEYDDDSVD